VITNQEINSLSAKELESRIFALADDAGAFTIPQVRMIITKMLSEDYTMDISEELDSIRMTIDQALDDMADASTRLSKLERTHGVQK
jgi:hypothetical protein